MASELKRKRGYSPEAMIALRVNPPLPQLSKDGTLTVFTHPSLAQGSDIPNNLRYQRIGEVALQYAVTRLLWMRDDAPAKAIEEELATYLSEDNIADWSRQYRLRQSLRYGPDVAASVDKPAEQANLFKAYAGAVDAELGPAALTSWIENIITMPYSPDGPQSPPPMQSPPPQNNVKSGAYSALLNESAQQRRHKLDFQSESTGPSHNLVWTMRVLVDGHERGVGTGGSKAAAKEDAARKTCFQMGWKI